MHHNQRLLLTALLLLALSPAACHSGSAVTEAEIDDYCSHSCRAFQGEDFDCASDEKRWWEGASVLGCAEEYDAYFSCASFAVHKLECVDEFPPECTDERATLRRCVEERSPDDACDRVPARFLECTGEAQRYSDGPCVGDWDVARAECFINASCAELQAWGLDGMIPPGLTQCFADALR